MKLTDQLAPLLRATGYHEADEEGQYSKDGIDLIFTESGDCWTVQAWKQSFDGQDPDEWPGVLEVLVGDAEQVVMILVAARLLPAGITTAMQ